MQRESLQKYKTKRLDGQEEQRRQGKGEERKKDATAFVESTERDVMYV